MTTYGVKGAEYWTRKAIKLFKLLRSKVTSQTQRFKRIFGHQRNMGDFMQPAPAPKTALGQHRPLSSTAGIRVSPLILGGMSIGEAWSSFMGSLNKKQAFGLLDAYVDAGGNFLDTANAYQSGQSEGWIGEWMKERKNRDQVVLATKFSFHYKADTGPEKNPANNNYWGNHKRSMNVSLRDSLAKLQTDWVDILYVHFWDYTTSIEEVMDSLHLLVQQGKVLYLGISDSPAWVVAAANNYAKAHGKAPFSIYQGRWNVMLRDFEREILPMATYFGMAIAPWDVLGSGKFKRPEEIAEKNSKGEVHRFGMEQTEEERKMSAALSKVADAHGVKSPTAIALAYVRSKAPNVIPLVGGRKVEHLRDNIKGLEIKLSAEEIEFLESQKDFDIGFPGTFIGRDWQFTGKPALAIISQGPIQVGGWP